MEKTIRWSWEKWEKRAWVVSVPGLFYTIQKTPGMRTKDVIIGASYCAYSVNKRTGEKIRVRVTFQDSFSLERMKAACRANFEAAVK